MEQMSSACGSEMRPDSPCSSDTVALEERPATHTHTSVPAKDVAERHDARDADGITPARISISPLAMTAATVTSERPDESLPPGFLRLGACVCASTRSMAEARAHVAEYDQAVIITTADELSSDLRLPARRALFYMSDFASSAALSTLRACVCACVRALRTGQWSQTGTSQSGTPMPGTPSSDEILSPSEAPLSSFRLLLVSPGGGNHTHTHTHTHTHSRAYAVAVAVYMHTHGATLSQALDALDAVRPYLRLSLCMLTLLHEYESCVCVHTSTHMHALTARHAARTCACDRGAVVEDVSSTDASGAASCEGAGRPCDGPCEGPHVCACAGASYACIASLPCPIRPPTRDTLVDDARIDSPRAWPWPALRYRRCGHALKLSACARASAVRELFLRRDMESVPASLVLPGLWISEDTVAKCREWLLWNQIDVVINCAAELCARAVKACSTPTTPSAAASAAAEAAAPVPARMVLCPIHETEQFDATAALISAADTIHDALKARQRVLVHCVIGMNRSVSAVVVYLMRYHGISLLDALATIRSRRAIAYPNPEMFPNLLRIERETFPEELAAAAPALPQSALNVIPPDVHRILLAQNDAVHRPPLLLGVHAADEAANPALSALPTSIPKDAVLWLHKRRFRGGLAPLEAVWPEY